MASDTKVEAQPESALHHYATAYLTDTYVFNWQNQTFRADLLFVIPVAICLGVGVAVGHPAAGMIAAGGAMTVGFGAKQNIDNSQLLPMIFASFGMAFSTFVGMVAGHTDFTIVLIAALWGFGYGLLTGREDGYGWVGQQCLVTLLVASAFPFSAKEAILRALIILAGGALQVVLSSVVLKICPQLLDHLKSLITYARAEQAALRAAMANVTHQVKHLEIRDSVLPYALRMMVVVGVSTEIYLRMHIASGYWIPMTALLVLKPGLADTASRAIARTLGTIAGAWLVSVLVAHFTPAPLTLAIFALIFAWLSYATTNVNYALFAVFITAHIVFLLSLAHVPQMQIAHLRALCTAIGGGLALMVRLIVIYRRRDRLRKSMTPVPS
jgi:Fusaric acid resistance protein-like